jgi:hypothetical protein
LFAVAWFKLPEPPTPQWGALPVPTVLALGGALAGLLLAALCRAAARVGGRRRQDATRRVLHRATAQVADELVLDPLDGELAALAELQDLARRLR